MPPIDHKTAAEANNDESQFVEHPVVVYIY